MSVVDLGKSTLSTPVTDGFWAAEVLETGSGTRPQAACHHLLLPWLQVSLAPLWKKWKYTSKCTRANSQVSWVPGQSVLGVFVCLQEWVVSEFCGTKFCLCLLVGRGLWCSSPSSPLLLLVCFHYNDDMMSFGVILQSIFPSSWADLVSTSPCGYWLLSPPQGFPAINCFPLIMHGGGGSGKRT